jgi:peptidoglycan/xylan/chitin deacetylase (PgdA/CDA1 family)
MVFFFKSINVKWKFFFLLILLSLASFPLTLYADVTVLIYHRFGEDRYPSTNVSLENFKEQMAYLLANNYQVMPLAEVVEIVKNKKALPEKAAVITIDDGYKSVYLNAWPVLKSFGYPFTVFLYVKATDRGYKNFLSWNQVREMKAAGVDFQDHGYGHHRFGSRKPGHTVSEYRESIRLDFDKSYNIMSEQLGEKPRFLALPYGEYNQIVIDEAKKIGYEAVFSQDPGVVSADTDLLRIPREPILGNEWASIGHFEKIMTRNDLPFSEMTPSLDPLLDNSPSKFSVRLSYPDRYRKGTLGIYISELGWKQGKLDGDVLTVYNEKELSRRQNRIAVSGSEKKSGRIAIRYWMIIRDSDQ